jgi:hypothetical protein
LGLSTTPEQTTPPENSSTPELVHFFFTERLVAPLRDLFVDALKPANYERIFAYEDFRYRSPGKNKVKMMTKGRRFVIVTESGEDIPVRDFVGWVEDAYQQAVAIDKNVARLEPEEINHLLAEFQDDRVLASIMQPIFRDRKIRLLQPSIRRKSGHASTHTVEPIRSIAVGGGTQGIVGSPGDSFRLEKYPEVKRWMDEVVDRGLGTQYNWKLNPRRRRRIRGQIRPRWVFRVSRGAPGEKLEILIKDVLHPAADLLPSMNWGAIARKFIPVSSGASHTSIMRRELPRIIDGHYTTTTKRRRFPMVVPISARMRGGHAIVGILRERGQGDDGGRLELILIDPHGEITFDREVVALLQDVKTPRPMVVVPAHVSNPRLLAVQFAPEGSCSISSLAIMLAAARYLGKASGITRDSADTLATKILRSVSDLDVVLASQIMHRF